MVTGSTAMATAVFIKTASMPISIACIVSDERPIPESTINSYVWKTRPHRVQRLRVAQPLARRALGHQHFTARFDQLLAHNLIIGGI